jgi:F-box/WD-40 domain protein 7
MTQSENDKIWVGTETGAIHLFKAATKKKLNTMQMHSAAITGFFVRETLKDQPTYVLSCSADGSIVKWDGEGNYQFTFHGHVSTVFFAIAVTSTLILSGGDDGTIRVWDSTTGACLHCVVMQEGAQYCAAACGEFVWTASEKGVLTIWATRSLRWEPVAVKQFDLEEDRKVTGMQRVGPHLWTWNDRDTEVLVWDIENVTLYSTLQHKMRKSPLHVIGVQTVSTRYVWAMAADNTIRLFRGEHCEGPCSVDQHARRAEAVLENIDLTQMLEGVKGLDQDWVITDSVVDSVFVSRDKSAGKAGSSSKRSKRKKGQHHAHSGKHDNDNNGHDGSGSDHHNRTRDEEDDDENGDNHHLGKHDDDDDDDNNNNHGDNENDQEEGRSDVGGNGDFGSGNGNNFQFEENDGQQRQQQFDDFEQAAVNAAKMKIVFQKEIAGLVKMLASYMLLDEELKKELDLAKSRLNESWSQNTQMKLDLEEAMKDREKVQEQMQLLCDKIGACESQRIKDLNSFTKQTEILRQEAAKSTAANDKTQRAMASLTAANAELARQNAHLKEQLNYAEDQRKVLQETDEWGRKESDKLRQIIHKGQVDAADLNALVEKMKGEMKTRQVESNSIIRSKDSDLQQISSTMDELMRERDAIRVQLVQSQRKVDEAAVDKADLEHRLNKVSTQLRQVMQQNASDISNLKQQLDKAEQSKQEWFNMAQTLGFRLDRVGRELKLVDGQIESIRRVHPIDLFAGMSHESVKMFSALSQMQIGDKFTHVLSSNSNNNSNNHHSDDGSLSQSSSKKNLLTGSALKHSTGADVDADNAKKHGKSVIFAGTDDKYADKTHESTGGTSNRTNHKLLSSTVQLTDAHKPFDTIHPPATAHPRYKGGKSSVFDKDTDSDIGDINVKDSFKSNENKRSKKQSSIASSNEVKFSKSQRLPSQYHGDIPPSTAATTASAPSSSTTVLGSQNASNSYVNALRKSIKDKNKEKEKEKERSDSGLPPLFQKELKECRVSVRNLVQLCMSDLQKLHIGAPTEISSSSISASSTSAASTSLSPSGFDHASSVHHPVLFSARGSKGSKGKSKSSGNGKNVSNNKRNSNSVNFSATLPAALPSSNNGLTSSNNSNDNAHGSNQNNHHITNRAGTAGTLLSSRADALLSPNRYTVNSDVFGFKRAVDASRGGENPMGDNQSFHTRVGTAQSHASSTSANDIISNNHSSVGTNKTDNNNNPVVNSTTSANDADDVANANLRSVDAMSEPHTL